MSYNFDYLIEKIDKSNFSNTPFQHIYIEDFLTESHFREIISSSEISLPCAESDRGLIKCLLESGWKVIKFPGCTTDIDKYIDWHANVSTQRHHSATEGFGMALRLYEAKSPIISALSDFITSRRFYEMIAKKFSIDVNSCLYDGGIQKYLDGYEISPHADVRRKAATFMVNINPHEDSESSDHHTHYLSFSPEREYVKTFWEGNEGVDRCWLPWAWTKSEKMQCANNSIVLFSPSNDTLHGVKANYDHLKAQRTQLYGNLWYENTLPIAKLEWEHLDLNKYATSPRPDSSSEYKIKPGIGKRNI